MRPGERQASGRIRLARHQIGKSRHMAMGTRAERGARGHDGSVAASMGRWGLICCALALLFGALLWASQSLAQEASEGPVEEPPIGLGVPGGTSGAASDSDFWREIRQGDGGLVNIENPNAGVLIRSEGETWRQINSVALPTYGAMYMAGMLIVLCLFFALHGRVRLEHGRSDRKILRFKTIDRAAHWLLASSFLILAVTGLMLRYGRELLIPVIGHGAFAEIASIGKYLHNSVAFAFMAGLVLVFVLWIRENIPNRHDALWVVKGGGLLPGIHAPARKFNAGQKFVFWAVIGFGILLSMSGIALLFPFTTGFTADIFWVINAVFQTSLPTELSPLQEQHYSQLWHSIISMVFIIIIMGHIYIGTIGMEGAFEAMGSGEVDSNWAREHHSLWVEEVEAETVAGKVRQSETPAE